MSFFGGLVDSFTGEGAKKALQEGLGNQLSVAQATQDKQTGAINASGTEARGYYKPYVDQGGRAFGLYGDTLGVNGADARKSAQDLYYSDPNQQRITDLALRAGDRASNAGGYFSGARGALLAGRLAQEQYGNWQNKLNGMGQQGQQAAAGMAGIAANEGNALAGAYGNYGASVGNAYGQNAQGMAQANNVFAQNLIGLGSAAVSAYTGIPMRKPGVATGANNLAGYAPTYGFVNPNNNDPAYG
jgi:hypothetical protein